MPRAHSIAERRRRTLAAPREQHTRRLNDYTLFYVPAALDRRLSDFAVRLYAQLLARDAWRQSIEITTGELADANGRHVATVRTALLRLERAGYITRHIRGRAQIVRALHWQDAPGR